jgi:hypothetical protein
MEKSFIYFSILISLKICFIFAAYSNNHFNCSSIFTSLKKINSMSNLHTIKALLYDNALTENPNDFSARVSTERSLSVKDICRSAVSRGGATVSADAMEIAVSQFHKEMAYNLCDGFGVNTEWYTVSVSIKGVFDSPNEKFNPAKHTVSFDFRQGSLLRKELATVDVQILGVADTMLSIAQVTDVKSGSVNDLLTPGRNLRISGRPDRHCRQQSVGAYHCDSRLSGRHVQSGSNYAIQRQQKTVAERTAHGSV